MAPPLAPSAQFTGTWKKDAQRSDGIDCACKLLKLGSLFKHALSLTNTMTIDLNNGLEFKGSISMPMGLAKNTEVYPLDGKTCEAKRRDQRPGSVTGHVETTSNPLCFKVKTVWPAPFSGTAVDTYQLSPDGSTLTVQQVLAVGGETCNSSTVYCRAK